MNGRIGGNESHLIISFVVPQRNEQQLREFGMQTTSCEAEIILFLCDDADSEYESVGDAVGDAVGATCKSWWGTES